MQCTQVRRYAQHYSLLGALFLCAIYRLVFCSGTCTTSYPLLLGVYTTPCDTTTGLPH